MKEIILKQLNLYMWAKDKNYRYLYCNEHYAMAAGLDSPNEIIGKTDDQLPWRELADLIRVGDYSVLKGNGRVNAQEVTNTINNVKDILVTENQLLDNHEKCIGVVGSFVDITGNQLMKKMGYYDQIKKRYYLDEENFNNVYLSAREIDVFKRLLLGCTAQQIAEILKISRKTVEGYIENIKYKLQAKSKGEIIATAIQFGLTHILHSQSYHIV